MVRAPAWGTDGARGASTGSLFLDRVPPAREGISWWTLGDTIRTMSRQWPATSSFSDRVESREPRTARRMDSRQVWRGARKTTPIFRIFAIDVWGQGLFTRRLVALGGRREA